MLTVYLLLAAICHQSFVCVHVCVCLLGRQTKDSNVREKSDEDFRSVCFTLCFNKKTPTFVYFYISRKYLF